MESIFLQTELVPDGRGSECYRLNASWAFSTSYFVHFHYFARFFSAGVILGRYKFPVCVCVGGVWQFIAPAFAFQVASSQHAPEDSWVGWCD